MLARSLVAITLALLSAACGGGAPRSATADLASVRQPTPDPTLDAVVRDLPRMLAGVVAPSPSPTATPLPQPTPRTVAVPKPKPAVQATPVPTAKPTVRPAAPTPSVKPRP